MKMSEIIIQPAFLETAPRKEKLDNKKDYLLKHQEYESDIIINDENILIDGYTSYILAHFCHILPKVYKKTEKGLKKVRICF